MELKLSSSSLFKAMGFQSFSRRLWINLDKVIGKGEIESPITCQLFSNITLFNLTYFGRSSDRFVV